LFYNNIVKRFTIFLKKIQKRVAIYLNALKRILCFAT